VLVIGANRGALVIAQAGRGMHVYVGRFDAMLAGPAVDLEAAAILLESIMRVQNVPMRADSEYTDLAAATTTDLS
jgi:hypothetical protein